MTVENQVYQKSFESRIELLHPILEWVEKIAADAGFNEYAQKEVDLAIEETLVNIIHHAYHNTPGIIDIKVVSVPLVEIQIILEDQGPIFDPLQEEISLEKDVPLEERLIGGLGILLIRKNMDEIKYQRLKNKNQLTLIKKYCP